VIGDGDETSKNLEKFCKVELTMVLWKRYYFTAVFLHFFLPVPKSQVHWRAYKYYKVPVSITP
jgi:hypothetical protein